VITGGCSRARAGKAGESGLSSRTGYMLSKAGDNDDMVLLISGKLGSQLTRDIQQKLERCMGF
jgi:hypothetical protein